MFKIICKHWIEIEIIDYINLEYKVISSYDRSFIGNKLKFDLCPKSTNKNKPILIKGYIDSKNIYFF